MIGLPTGCGLFLEHENQYDEDQVIDERSTEIDEKINGDKDCSPVCGERASLILEQQHAGFEQQHGEDDRGGRREVSAQEMDTRTDGALSRAVNIIFWNNK